jgi:hypothetical protein
MSEGPAESLEFEDNGETVGIGADPVIYDANGNKYELPVDERIYCLLKSEKYDLLINVKTKIIGRESYNKYFYIYFRGTEFIFDVETYKFYLPDENNKMRMNNLIKNFKLEMLKNIETSEIEGLKINVSDTDNTLKMILQKKIVLRFWKNNRGVKLESHVEKLNQDEFRGILVGIQKGQVLNEITSWEDGNDV